jgi:hypothetical protein
MLCVLRRIEFGQLRRDLVRTGALSLFRSCVPFGDHQRRANQALQYGGRSNAGPLPLLPLAKMSPYAEQLCHWGNVLAQWLMAAAAIGLHPFPQRVRADGLHGRTDPDQCCDQDCARFPKCRPQLFVLVNQGVTDANDGL